MARSTTKRERAPVRTAIPVDAAVLRWARESMGLTLPIAAKKAGIKVEKLEEWEETEAFPTARQLERFANAYKRPLAVFFRTEPPPEPSLPADFRVIKPGQRRELSPESLVAIRRARHLQASYAELRGPAEISLTLDPQDSEGSAREVRKKLGVSLDEQTSLQTDDAALRKWRSAVERVGILVFQFSFPVEEMRGFSLPGEVPLIVLNNKDAYTARCFTLFHEAAHVWLGKPGICNPDGRVRVRQKGSLEVYCNAFAAELLVPMRAFAADENVLGFKEGRTEIRAVLDKGARRFHVSPQVILRRLYTAQMITESLYQDWSSQLSAEAIARLKRKTKSKGGPAPSRKALSELGEPFVRTVLTARDRGVITDADVTDYLSVGYGHVEKIESILP